MKDLLLFLKKWYNKGAFHIFSGQFLTKFISFFGSKFIIRILSKTEYGVLSYYENLYGYAFIFAGFGLSNSILRYVVLGRDKEQKYKYFRYSIIQGFIFNFVLTVVLVIINIYYQHPYEYSSYSILLIIFACELPFKDLITCFLYNERAMFENQRYALSSLIISAIMVASKIFGAVLYGLIGTTIFQIGSTILCSAFLYKSEKKRYYAELEIPRITTAEKKEINTYAFQYMITNGLWVIFMLNNIFMLGRLGASAVTLAEYKVAYVLPANLAILSSSIGLIISPYFIKNGTDRFWVVKNLKKVFIVSLGIVSFAALAVGFLAHPLAIFMYGKEYENIVNLMRLMLISSVINSGVRYTLANILAAIGKIKINLYIAVIGIVIQVSINLFLIPLYGAQGTVISSLISYSIMSIFLFVAFYRIYYLKQGSAI